MKPSTINVYFWPELSKVENYPTTNYKLYFKNEWFEEPFTQFVLEHMEGCQWIENDVLRSPVLGIVPIERLSGAFKTLVMAWHFKDMKFPLRNLGDNCASCILESGTEGATSWAYQGYMPDLLPEQIVCFPELNKSVTGDNVHKFLLFETPAWCNPGERRRRRYREIIEEEGSYY